MECFALLDDCAATAAQPTSRLYTGFRRQRVCAAPDVLDAFWREVEADLAAGLHAVVLADYEWGARLQGIPAAAPGALRVLLFSEMRRMAADEVAAWLAAGGESGAGLLRARASVDAAAFTAAISEIQRAIAAGETYQVNYSYRLDATVAGSPLALYRALRQRQPVPYGALIALPPGEGPRHVLSFSPELFVRNDGGRLTTRPMKGTAARGDDAAAEAAAHATLANAKNRAENLMIVDLLRNDLGRIARLGSVRVPELFAVEPYASVYQMTSTVTAELPPAIDFPAVLRALFPCGSVTGAPKHHTMELIARLENEPRGLYCGAIGWLDAAPAGRASGDFCLSVAIRTLTLGPTVAGLRPARLGVGAGIVADSVAVEERAECELKAGFFSGLGAGFSLIETLYATSSGVRHQERHLARLAASAAELGFACPLPEIDAALAAAVTKVSPGGTARLRLLLAADGSVEVTLAPLPPNPAEPVTLLLADAPLVSDELLLRHKTTLRGHYDAALKSAEAAGAFDVLFCNERGELTEGARSNVFLRIDGAWLTPPLTAGLLPGVMRGVLLDDPAWAAREARLTPADLARAEGIVVCNALRGPLRARLG